MARKPADSPVTISVFDPLIDQDTKISVTGCPKAKTAAQLRAAKLAAALKACHKKHGSKRSGCEKAARKKYKKKK